MDFIASPYCTSCGTPLPVRILDNCYCTRCYHNKPNYNLLRSLFKFNEFSKRIIHQFKYHDKTILAKIFAKLLYYRYNTEIADIDFIVPVPMNRFKRLFRQYNPAHVLAKEISKLINKPLKGDVLIKTKWTKSQTFLSKKQRKDNVKNSIVLNPKYQIAKAKILLIDDVVTTGVTIDECSKILHKAGADGIYVIAAAMT